MDKQNASRPDSTSTASTAQAAGAQNRPASKPDNGRQGGGETTLAASATMPRATNGPADGARQPASRGATAVAEAFTGIEELTQLGTTKMQDTVFEERDDVLSVINELEDQLDRYQDIRSSLERDLVQSNEQLVAAQQRVQELEWQGVTLQTRVDALEQVKSEVGILEEQIEEANTRAQRLAEQCVQSDKEISKLGSELKTANKQLEELWTVRKERDGLRGDLRALRARLDELERNQRETMEERAAFQSRVQETQLALEEARSARMQLEQTLQATNDRVQELQRLQKALEERIEAGRVDKKNLQAQIGHLERENARLVEQRQFYESELTGLRNSNRHAEAALVSMKKAFAEVRIAVTETRTRARRRTMDLWPRIGSIGAGSPQSASAELAAATPIGVEAPRPAEILRESAELDD